MQQLDEPCDSRFDPDMAEDVMMAGLVYLLSMYDLYDVTIWITNPTMGFFFWVIGIIGYKDHISALRASLQFAYLQQHRRFL